MSQFGPGWRGSNALQSNETPRVHRRVAQTAAVKYATSRRLGRALVLSLVGFAGMPIHGLLEQEQTDGAVFSPEDLTTIIAAYELVLTRLKVDDRKAPMATLVAKTVIQIAKEGERDPERLSERVIRLYRVNPR
jgi:hypothetical protein